LTPGADKKGARLLKEGKKILSRRRDPSDRMEKREKRDAVFNGKGRKR